MGKNKLKKFNDLESFSHVFQLSLNEIRNGKEFSMKGKWNELFFKNSQPIVVELGCGKGEYTVGLAQLFPNKNFIGIDIKGARMWTGAKQSIEAGLSNVAFLRTKIEMLTHFFCPNEVSEIWITFPDPQMKKVNKRLTSTNLLQQYQQLLQPNGLIHLKTDSNFLYSYTCEMVKANGYTITFNTNDLYNTTGNDPILTIKTYYEQQWLARAIPIKYLTFELAKREQFIEPDVEIEPDNYRSFGRNKRSELNLSN